MQQDDSPLKPLRKQANTVTNRPTQPKTSPPPDSHLDVEQDPAPPSRKQRYELSDPVLRPVRSMGASGVRVETPRGSVRDRNVPAGEYAVSSPDISDEELPRTPMSSTSISGNAINGTAISGNTRASPPPRHGGNALRDSRSASVAWRVEEAFAGMGVSDSDSDFDGLD